MLIKNSCRYLQAMKSGNGEVILVGKSFDPNIEKWDEEVLCIPRRKSSEGVVKSVSGFLHLSVLRCR